MPEKRVKSKEELAAEEAVTNTIAEVNGVLARQGTVIQPFIEYAPYGAIPRVRIILKPVEEQASEKDLAAKVEDNAGNKQAKRSKR